MLLLAAAFTLVSAAPASAQNFGGGTLSRAKLPRAFEPILTIGLQQRGDRMAFRFVTTLKCGRDEYTAEGRREVPIAGGRFRASRATIETINTDRDRIVYRWRMRAVSDGTTVTGRVRITGELILGGRRTACTAKPVRRFKARVQAPIPAGAPKPGAGTAFGGVSDVTTARLPGPVMLRVSRDGARVGAIWWAVAPCAKGAAERFVNISPTARIRADGTFSRPERFRRDYRGLFVRYRVEFSGRFSGEGAGGTFRAVGRIYRKGSKKFVTRCDSGVRTWSAGLLR